MLPLESIRAMTEHARQNCSTIFCRLGLGTGQAEPASVPIDMQESQDRLWAALGWAKLQYLPVRAEIVCRPCQAGSSTQQHVQDTGLEISLGVELWRLPAGMQPGTDQAGQGCSTCQNVCRLGLEVS